MRINRILFIVVNLLFAIGAAAQVKPGFLYNKGAPFGTLDIRTIISSTDYFYLKEGETFSFRRNADGLLTLTYRDKTLMWDSSPYEEGQMRRKTGPADRFVMNYRILKPLSYDPGYAEGYPLVIVMHGATERANCNYNNCYHAGWNYDPNTNFPAAPVSSDHELLNNDHQVNLGGREHLDARRISDGKLPNDPTLPPRAFPGFVIFPQMMNDWDSLSVENAIRIVLLHIKEYNIDPDRIYIHGLSIGGYAVLEALMRAPWLFAAALPISVIRGGNLAEKKLGSKIANIPIWIFQGSVDESPTAETTRELVHDLEEAGVQVRYSEYPGLGHAVWNKAYGEPDFFQFMLRHSKADIHIYKGDSVIKVSENSYPILKLSEGFFAYQWEKDGKLIAADQSTLEVKEPGVYRARFSRDEDPSARSWNRWSSEVIITSDGEGTGEVVTAVPAPKEKGLSIYPNPGRSADLSIRYAGTGPLSITITDVMGRAVHRETNYYTRSAERKFQLARALQDGIYLVTIQTKSSQYVRRICIANQ